MTERSITYGEAIREATDQAFELDPSVFLIGQGTRGAGHIFGTVRGLYDKYGPERVVEMPLSESAMMGIAIGAALDGLRPLLVLQRADFLFLVLDQLINHASKWRFTYGEGSAVPVTVRCIVGQGWGQGPQHSQSLHSLCSHFPGLRVVCPSMADDAKGLLLNAIFSDDPVVIFEGRPLHRQEGIVPMEPYVKPFGQARRLSAGRDVTILNVSFLLAVAQRAAEELERQALSVELIDLVSASPIDYETVLESVNRTGRLVILDTSWRTAGIASTIAAEVSRQLFGRLKAPVEILTVPDHPVSTAVNLEASYYPTADHLLACCRRLLERGPS